MGTTGWPVRAINFLLPAAWPLGTFWAVNACGGHCKHMCDGVTLIGDLPVQVHELVMFDVWLNLYAVMGLSLMQAPFFKVAYWARFSVTK